MKNYAKLVWAGIRRYTVPALAAVLLTSSVVAANSPHAPLKTHKRDEMARGVVSEEVIGRPIVLFWRCP